MLDAWALVSKLEASGVDAWGLLDKALPGDASTAKIEKPDPDIHAISMCRLASDGMPHVTRSEITAKTAEEVADYLYFKVLDAAGIDRGDFSDFAATVHKLPQHWRLICAVCWLQAEVDNGGHEQFFDNGHGEFDAETEADLRFIGANKFLKLYLEARGFFYNCTAVRKERCPEVEPLDDTFYKQKKSPYVLVGEYVLCHLADYCVD